MTVSLELFKDITLEFTQDYTPFKIRCPICVIEKKYIGHCKFKKNLPIAWQQIQRTYDHLSAMQKDMRHTVFDNLSKESIENVLDWLQIIKRLKRDNVNFLK